MLPAGPVQEQFAKSSGNPARPPDTPEKLWFPEYLKNRIRPIPWYGMPEDQRCSLIRIGKHGAIREGQIDKTVKNTVS